MPGRKGVRSVAAGTQRLGLEGPAVGAVLTSLKLERAWLVDPGSGRSGSGALRVEDGVVTEVRWAAAGAGTRARKPGASEAGTPSVVVVPGFIDLHAHVREPGGEDAESFATGLAAAAHGGFTFLCTMSDTRPPIDRPEVVQRVVSTASAAGSPVRARPFGALTLARDGKTIGPLASLAAAGVVGFSDDPAPTTDPAVLRAALTEAGALGLPVVVHADEPSLSDGAEANEGLPATILGLRGASAAAEVSAVARAVAVLRQVSAEAPSDVRPHLHVAHLSAAESLEPIRAARSEGLRITCDVTPHHLALHDGWLGGDRRWSWEAAASPWAGRAASGRVAVADPYGTSVRVDPPLRGAADAIALLAAVADGTVDAIATDHSPVHPVGKDLPFGDATPGMSGLETALGLVLEAVAAGRLSLVRALRALSLGPWRAIDGARLDIGEPLLREGASADLVTFDLAGRWTVSPATLSSRSSNTPLLGRSLPGRVLMTVARGRIAWLDPEA